jgi:oligopeptide transport system substrate-binding protein
MNGKLFSVLFLALGLTVSCTKKSKVDYDLNIDETLRWDIATEPPSLDWTVATDTTSSRILDTLTEGLTRYGFKENNETVVEPCLAASWESSKDLKTWTFTLRQDVKWSDGAPFTGQQVLDGWERLLNKKTGAEYANFLYNIKNAEQYYNGKVTDFSQVGAKLNDKGQIVVELVKPQSYFPMLLAHHATYPIRKDLIAKFGDKWAEAGNFVGLGAFKLKIWEHDKAVVLERNDLYFGHKAKLKYILGRVIPEASTALNMFKKGELDALDDLPKVEAQSYKQMKEYRLQPNTALYFFGINTKTPPLNNVKVRRALSMAIDRNEIQKIQGGSPIPAYNVVPPGLIGHEPNVGLKFDVAGAAKMLDDAGFKDRSTFPRLVLGLNTNENHQRIAENVQAQFKKNLGIDIEVVNEEWKTYLKALDTDKYNLFRFGWVGDFPDPDTFINLFVTNGGNNKTKWGNKHYDDLVEKGLSESDPNKRKDIYIEAQKLLDEDEIPIIPIYYYRDEFLISSRVKNYPLNIMYRFYAEDTEIVK